MAKIKIEGTEYEVEPAVKAYIDALKAKEETAKVKGDSVDALQGRYDALEVKLQNTEQELENAKAKQVSADELDKQVEARVTLINTAQPLLGDSFDFTGKSEREIKEAVISTAKAEFKGDCKSDDYINAFFDATVEQVQSTGFSSVGANNAFTGDTGGDKSLQEKKNQRLNMRS